MYLSSKYAGPGGPAFFLIIILGIVALLWQDTAAAQAHLLPTTTLTIGSQPLTVEIAATEPSRNYGLMNRPSLPADHGMLFVFDQESRPCFWMKNTPLPLTIAFIDRNGIITNLADMQPYSEASHCPIAPVLYALEMEQGWFKTKGIQAGQRVNELPAQQP